MDEAFALVFVPMVLFLIFVAPTWLFLHYRSKRRAESALSEDERAELERLTVSAGRMSERIETWSRSSTSELPTGAIASPPARSGDPCGRPCRRPPTSPESHRQGKTKDSR